MPTKSKRGRGAKVGPEKKNSKAAVQRNAQGVAYPVGTCVFNPNAEWRGNWDLICMVLLIITAFLGPFEIAFLPSSGLPNPDALYFFNKCIDVVFVVDMCFNFNTGYFSYKHGVWVTKPRQVIKNYVKGWFTIDFTSILPFEDLFYIMSGPGASSGGELKLIKLIRILRLAKLLKVLRASRIINRWSKNFSMSFGMQTVCSSLVKTVIAMHWSACAIRLISDMHRSTCREDCFLGNFFKSCEGCNCLDDLASEAPGIQTKTSAGYDVAEWYDTVINALYSNRNGKEAQGISTGDCFDGYLDDRNPKNDLYNVTYFHAQKVCMRQCKPKNWLDTYGFGWTGNPANVGMPAVQYVAALYWSIVVLKGTDFQSINVSEYTLSVILMIIGGGIYAMMIGDVANVIANLDEAGNEYKKVMDNLNQYMNSNHFDAELKIKLRSYFQHCKSLFANEYHRDTLRKMSPVLRGEVANHENGGWVVQIPFFAKAPRKELRELITEISMVMEPEVYVPSDIIVAKGSMNKKMFVMDKGLAVMNVPNAMPQFLSIGAVFGDDIIIKTLTDSVQQRKWQVTAMQYVDVHTLEAQKLLIVLTNGSFPETYKSVRRTGLKLLLRTHFPPFLRKHMNDPNIQSLHDLVEAMTGATRNVDVAVEQRVEEGNVINAGLKPEEMTQIMRRFDSYIRAQKDMQKFVDQVFRECKTVRRDLYEWTKDMEERVAEKEAEEAEKERKREAGEEDENNEEDQGPVELKPGQVPNAKPGHSIMLSMPAAMVPPDLRAAFSAGVPIPGVNAVRNGASESDIENDEKGFASQENLESTIDRIKVLETRIKNLSSYIVATKRQPELKEQLASHQRGLADLEAKHKAIKARVRSEIRSFNQRKMDRIEAERTAANKQVGSEEKND